MTTLSKSWKERFEDKFAGQYGYCNPTIAAEIKDFIEKELSSQLTELEGKVESMEREFPLLGAQTHQHSQQERENFGYNKALSDVSSLISDLKK